MAVINTNLVCDLQNAVKVQYLDGNIFSQDNQGNVINVTVLDGGEPATLSGTISANIIRADGGTVAATGGTITDNVASITLPAAAYAIPGVVSIVIKNTVSSVVTTIAAIVANVYQSSTDTVVDPGTIIPSIQTLISSIETAVASIPADYSSLWTSLAPAFSSSANYVTGQYVTYNGGLYRFTTAHSGSWSSSDVVATNLGGDVSDLKSALTQVKDGSYTFPLASGELIRKSILSDGKWTVATGGNQTTSSVYPIPISSNSIEIVCTTNETIIAFLKSYTGNEAENDAADFATHYTSRINISANTTKTYQLYGDEQYLFVLRKATAGAERTPYSATAYSDLLHGTDKTLSISGKAADAESVGTIVDGTIFPQMGNIVPLYTDYQEEKYGYASSVGQGITYGSNSDYDTIIVPVDESTQYSCNTLRYLTLLDSYYHAQAVSSENVTEFTTLSGTKYICASFKNGDYSLLTLVISPGENVDPSPVSHRIPWLYQPYGAITERIEKDFYRQYPFGEQYKGNDQSKVLGTANSIKKGKIINFSCDFSSFDTLHIKLQTAGGTVENDFAISSTNVVRTVDGSTKAPVAHGLTIQNTIGVRIEFTPSGFIFTIVSNGETFEQTYEYASAAVAPKYEVSGMTISNVDFSWTCKNFADGIWLFGDSYFSYGTNRWIYYLFENGYADHCLIDAYPGETSIRSIASLKSYISMSTPKYAVWCVGMNDGSDNGAPTTQWLNNVQEFLSVCSVNHITPILATIPTVPTINHDYKSAWVRNSGYQYIDFAKAVGASSEGWFDGMLANDGVHPTIAGSLALYHRAMTDCPQLYNML